jgi:hypothetical protein
MANTIPQYVDVSRDTMLEAIDLTKWFLNEAFRLYEMFDGAGDPDDRMAMKVKAKIRQLGGRATLRKLHGDISDFHGMKAEDVKNRLQEMVGTGLLSIQRVTAKNGREVEYYIINTSTLSTLNTDLEWSDGVDGVEALSVDKIHDENITDDEGKKNAVDTLIPLSVC